MRRIPIIALAGVLLLAACGQPEDLASLAGTSAAPATASTALPAVQAPSASPAATSVPLNTTAAAEEVPCPISGPYPAPVPGEPTPTAPPTPMPRPTIDPNTVPAAPAPGGLGSITLPTDDAVLRGVFANLPATIAGYDRAGQHDTDKDSFHVMYGAVADRSLWDSKLSLSARRHPKEENYAPLTLGLAHPSDPRGKDEQWWRDNQMFWIKMESARSYNQWMSPCYRSIELYWLLLEEGWSFRAKAESDAELEALIVAFVETVKSSPAPIPYVPPTPYPTAILPRSYPGPGSAYPLPRPVEPSAIPPMMPTMTATPTLSS